MSLGTPEPEVRQRYETTEDVRITYQGETVQAGGSHWQFVTYKSVIQQFLPFSMDRPMGQVRQLDQRMNEARLPAPDAGGIPGSKYEQSPGLDPRPF